MEAFGCDVRVVRGGAFDEIVGDVVPGLGGGDQLVELDLVLRFPRVTRVAGLGIE
jgi:hypothetical protein